MAKGKLTPPPPEEGNGISQDLPETEQPETPEENEDDN
jgi:hypothetical protein